MFSVHARRERGQDREVRASGHRESPADHCRAGQQRQQLPASSGLSSTPHVALGDDQVIVHASGVEHSCFFFPSAGERIYASLYRVPGLATRTGMVMCQPWGIEAHAFAEWTNRVAHDAARLGVPTIIPHWPGTQDSEGDPETLTYERMIDVTVDATEVAAGHCDASTWFPVGLRVGGAVAALATPALAARRLLLVEPALEPEPFFRDLERGARRASLGAAVPDGWAYSHPIPVALRAPEATARIADALAAFEGDGALVRHRRPARPTVAGLRTITTMGDFRSPPRVDHTPLRLGAIRWLRRSLKRNP